MNVGRSLSPSGTGGGTFGTIADLEPHVKSAVLHFEGGQTRIESMTSNKKSPAERSVAWQNAYLTPILLIVGMLLIAGSWAVGAISWWLAVILLAFGGVTLAVVISKRRSDT